MPPPTKIEANNNSSGGNDRGRFGQYRDPGTEPQWNVQERPQRANFADEKGDYLKDPEEGYYGDEYENEFENDYEKFYQPYEQYGESYWKPSQAPPDPETNDSEPSHEESANFDSATSQSEFTLECKKCNKKFYSNNKLHKHLRNCRSEKPPKIQKAAHVMTSLTPVIESTRKEENFHGFAFNSYQYVIVKRTLTLGGLAHALCMNSETSMSLMNRSFLAKHLPKIVIRRLTPSIKIRSIEAKIHDSSEYVIMDLFLSDRAEGSPMIAHLKAEFHLVDDLKANILVNMDIMGSENMILNFESRSVTIPTCKNIEMPVTIQKKKTFVHRSMRTASQTVISVGAVMTVPIKLRKAKLPKNRDYSFFPKNDRQLGPKRGFFAHVTDAEIKAIQIKNTSDRPFTIPKNFRIGHLRDYTKEGCFLAAPKDRHLAISSAQKLNLKQILRKSVMESPKKFSMKTVLSNEITVYGDKETVKKIIAITKKAPQM